MKQSRFLISLSGAMLLAGCAAPGPSVSAPPAFTAADLSPAPRAASALTQAAPSVMAQADPIAAFYPAGEEVTLDLDLDGDSETILFTSEDFEIDGVSYFSKISDFTEDMDPIFTNFIVADIDRDDDQREIAFMGRGPSDDPTTYFYTFREGDISEVGQIPTYIDSTEEQFDGNGQIKGIKRLSLLQTWYGEAVWQLVSGTIELVPDQIYEAKEYDWMEQVVLKKMLPIYRYPGDAEPFARIAPQDVRFLATDDKAWVKIEAPDGKDGDGMSGWFRITPFDLITDLDLPADDVFDHLSKAD